MPNQSFRAPTGGKNEDVFDAEPIDKPAIGSVLVKLIGRVETPLDARIRASR
jgi:hypothetical protein